MKASEVRLMVAIAAQNKTKLLKTDTKQAFLNGDIGDEKIYIRPPDWWPEPVPKGHALLLMKSTAACMVPDRQRDNGTSTFPDGWKRMVIMQSTMKRPCL